MAIKKRVLFVTDSLGCDGAARSLVSLLSVFDYDRYDVELMLLSDRDLFFAPMVPANVRRVEPHETVKAFFQPFRNAVLAMLKKGHLALGVYRIAFSVSVKLGPRFFQRLWIRLVQKLPGVTGIYDAVIGYQDIWAGYYAAFRTNGRVKIGWNHHDYLAKKRDRVADRLYLDKLNYLVTVSHASKASLCKALPEYESKIRIMPNVVPADLIRRMSMNGSGFDDAFTGVRVLTVGRVCDEKGIDMALEACASLVNDGYNIRWYVLGDGPMMKTLVRLSKKYSMEDRFIFLGRKLNPYPYFTQSEIYVQPSRTEANPIAVAEARILCKPIVVTDLPAFHAQIVNEVDGLIVPVSAEGIYTGVKRLLDDPRLMRALSENLAARSTVAGSDASALYQLLEA